MLQTYYVTLDLTTPHVPPSRRTLPTGGRNRRVRWINPGLENTIKRDLRELKTSKKSGATRERTADRTEAAEDQNKDKDDQGDSDTERADNSSQNDEKERQGSERAHDGNQNDIPGSQGGANNPDPAGNKVPDRPSSVQILDLHSKNPVVSYRGHMYSCQWVSNIGTELLFTRRDPKDPLPSLRTLPGDIDLLAASSARIVSSSIELKPKERSARFLQPSHAHQKGSDPSVPVGQGASVVRKDQARFLKQLMDVKEEKGEHDLVTVYAGARKTNLKWNEIMQKKLQVEKARLQKVIRKGGRGVTKAREDLEMIEQEEARRKELSQQRQQRHRPEPGKLQKRKRGMKDQLGPTQGRSSKKRVAVAATPEVDTLSDFGTPGYEMDSMTPSTPQRFDSEELENSDMDDEEMEEGESGEEGFYEGESDEEQFYEGESGEEQFSEDEELYEDAPAEDDDMHMYEGYD
jgi:hypothetical protein